MKTVKTFLITYKSGRVEKIFATSLEDLKEMVTWQSVKECTLIK
jgi:hypothetical protein